MVFEKKKGEILVEKMERSGWFDWKKGWMIFLLVFDKRWYFLNKKKINIEMKSDENGSFWSVDKWNEKLNG